MNEIEKNNFTLKNIKSKGSSLLSHVGGFIDNAVKVFKKDESSMSVEEKIEKQHLLNFGYGIGAGIVIYHFMIGAILILAIIWFYNLSLKKTKNLIAEQNPSKRTYKKRKTTKSYTEDADDSIDIHHT
ncbi:MAG: hypothetical protein Q9M36_05385 [Sulfurovum sp.]|nr:hypothetical protein [Sulfurovum sp.]